MFTRIVVGIDGSELATKALRYALNLAKDSNARMFVVTATEPAMLVAPGAEIMSVDTGAIIAELEEARAVAAKGILADAERLAQEKGVTIEPLHVAATVAADAIVRTANEKGADLIVMGSHGRRGLGRLLLGSQTSEVLAHATTPVLVIK